jgi:hypothetical protein
MGTSATIEEVRRNALEPKPTQDAGPRTGTKAQPAAAHEELLSLGITSLAAVVTAWSAFQASTWSGVQTFALASAAHERELSTQARLEGDLQMHLDADLFVAYAEARVEHRDASATFLHDRFPPRLKVATDAWLERHPFDSASAPPHPLAMPEYHVDASAHAVEAQEHAYAEEARAALANHNSDLYVLATVLLATVITVSSLGARLATPRARRTSLVLCGAVLLAVVVWMALRPVAWVSPGA